MNKYPSYDEMKDSGIEWLGEIPEHWDKVKLKYITSCLDNRRIPLNSSERSEMQGKYPYYGANGIVDWVNDFIFDEDIILLGEDGAPFKEFSKKVAFFINEKCWVNNHAHILKSDGINPIFLTYSLNCVNYNPYLSGSTRYKLTQKDMKKINIAFPPLKKQKSIAGFLDRETAKIEELIEKKEKLIELLEEKRQSTISQAVTKGLDYDVEIKDSGIEWLGEIPEHWDTIKLKFYMDTTKGYAFKSKNFSSKGVKIIKASHIKDHTIDFHTKSFLNENLAQNYDSVRLFTEDLIMSTVGSNISAPDSVVGQVALIPEKFNGSLLNQNTVRLENDNNIIKQKYLFYSLISNNCREYLNNGAHGTANQASLSLEYILNYNNPLPPLEEQKEIADYLDQETNRIDNLIEKTEEQIANLKEYKQALISNAVTGKIKIIDN